MVSSALHSCDNLNLLNRVASDYEKCEDTVLVEDFKLIKCTDD